MPRSRRHVKVAMLALCCLVVAACGSAASSPSSSPAPASLRGSLTVFAAASLTEAFTDAEKTLEAGHPGFTATYSFAGSQQLVANLRNGAPADVIATADLSSMQTLVTAGLVEAQLTFTRNSLAIAVARGNPKGIHSLTDLARPGISVVLADPAVPAGKFARQALQKAGVSVTPKSNELSVKSTLEKVLSGDADAAIVYTSDISAVANRADAVTIPGNQNVVAVYPMAVVKGTSHPDAAAAFVREAVSGVIQAALHRRGFLSP